MLKGKNENIQEENGPLIDEKVSKQSFSLKILFAFKKTLS
jgi:hypothetical protein